MIGTQLQQTKLVWLRKIIAALICNAEIQVKNKINDTEMYWKKRSKRLKTWMAQIKNNQSQVLDNEEPEILTIALMQAEQTLQSKLYRKYAEQMERMYR